ncbi:MAG: ABC transporter substrate-binding protein [Caldilineaceae bacterium]
MKSFNRREFLKFTAMGTGAMALAACAAPSAAPGAASDAAPAAGEEAAAGAGQLEIFSWWTAGGEVEGLNNLFEIYKRDNPGVEIINAAVAAQGAGQGGEMKALLETRMIGGDPPESFQVHLGRELIDSHVVADRMEPLDDLFAEEGWADVFPPDLMNVILYDGHPWSVPVNIHRSNLMWYRPSKLELIGASAPPASWDEFFEMAEALKAQGLPAIALGGSGGNGHTMESVILSVFGAADWPKLFDGTIAWSDERMTQALEIMNRLYDYAQPDFLSHVGAQVNDVMMNDDGPLLMISGDWLHGYFKSKEFTDYMWAPSPGTAGSYLLLSDSFGLPKGVKHRDNALAWLKVCGSKEGQDAFNPIKGSIPARTDADASVYDEYQLSAMEDWKKDTLVGSLQHGAAAKQSFLLDYDLALNDMIASRDVAATQAALVTAAEDAAFGQ